MDSSIKGGENSKNETRPAAKEMAKKYLENVLL